MPTATPRRSPERAAITAAAIVTIGRTTTLAFHGSDHSSGVAVATVHTTALANAATTSRPCRVASQIVTGNAATLSTTAPSQTPRHDPAAAAIGPASAK